MSDWSPELLLRAGRQAEQNGQYQDALNAYAYLVQQYPNSPEAALASAAIQRLKDPPVEQIESHDRPSDNDHDQHPIAVTPALRPAAGDGPAAKEQTSGQTSAPVNVRGVSLHSGYEAASRAVESAKACGRILRIVGIVVCILGVLVALQGDFSYILAGAALAGGGLYLFSTGSNMIVSAELIKANIDTADYARQSLLLNIGLAEGRSDIDLSP